MSLDEAREVFKSMEGPGDETARLSDWDLDIQKLMDMVDAAVLAERSRCKKIARAGLNCMSKDEEWIRVEEFAARDRAAAEMVPKSPGLTITKIDWEKKTVTLEDE